MKRISHGSSGGGCGCPVNTSDRLTSSPTPYSLNMKNPVDAYRRFCEARLQEVLLDNLKPRPQSAEELQPPTHLPPDLHQRWRRMVKQPWFRLAPMFTQLLGAHLRLDPTWRNDERWLDNTEFSSITTPDADTVRVVGSLWWGDCEDVGRAQTAEAVEAEFSIADQRLTYSIKLYADGLCRQIGDAGVRRTLIDAAERADVAALLASLRDGREKTPPKSPIIHRFLSALLKDIRYVTACTLAKMGRDGIEALAQLLSDDDPEIRCAAIYALGLAGEDARLAVPAILAAMPSAGQQFRCLAATALCHIGVADDEQSPFTSLAADLILALQESSYEQKALWRDASQFARAILVEVARLDKRALALLIEAFQKRQARHDIARIFYELGMRARAALPALSKAIDEASSEERGMAALALTQMGAVGMRALLEKLRHAEPMIRQATAHALEAAAERQTNRRQQANCKRAIPALLRALAEHPEDVRWRCTLALTLAKIDREDERVREALAANLPFLLRTLHHENDFFASYAARTLALLSERQPQALAALIEVVGDESRERGFREQVLEALSRTGAAAEVIIPLLLEKLKSDYPDYAKTVAALLNFGDAAIPLTLTTLADLIRCQTPPDEKGIRRYRAFEALAQIGAAAAPLLAEFVKDADRHTRVCAVRTLGKLGVAGDANDAATRHLLEAVTHADADTRAAAVESLAKICRRVTGKPVADAVIAALALRLDDEDLNVRARAVEALGQIGKPARAVLRGALDCEDSFVVMWAVGVLGRCGRGAKSLMPLRRAALRHQDDAVREVAAVMLRDEKRVRR